MIIWKYENKEYKWQLEQVPLIVESNKENICGDFTPLPIAGGINTFSPVPSDSTKETYDWDDTLSPKSVEKKDIILQEGEYDFKVTNLEKSYYDGSLRSKHVTINDIAEQFHGGGHANACGVKDLSEEDLENLLDKLYERIPHWTISELSRIEMNCFRDNITHA